MRMRFVSAVASLVVALAMRSFGAVVLSPPILPVSTDEIKLGEWNVNFSGGLAIADTFHVPMVVFFGGLSCGKCEALQRSCLSEEFLAWQNANKMVLIFTTDNAYGNASSFAAPTKSTGYPLIAIYWNRDGNVPAKNTQYYRTFNGREGEMLATGGSLGSQLRRSIEMVTEGYVYDPSVDVDISDHAEMLYSTPVTTKVKYDLKLFTSIDASSAIEPQRIYNVTDGYKITLRKVAGALPSGVKLVCSDGHVRLTGAARSPGSFTYKFSIQQRRNGNLHEGPPITLAIVVNAVGDVAAGGNAALGTVVRATLPLYLPEAGGNAMKGVLEFSQTALNKISAQYVGINRAKMKFAGSWSSLSAGVATAVMSARGGMTLTLTMGEGGRISASLRDPAYAAELTTGDDALAVGSGSYASAFAGAYTVALPENSANSGYGPAYVVVKKLAANGKAQWTAGLPNGKMLSGNATLTVDGEGNAVLPVFKLTAQDFIAAALRISPNSSMLDNPRAVADCAGTLARWGHVAKPSSVHDCTAYGGRYEAAKSLETASAQQYGTNRLRISAVADGFASGRYGAFASAPSDDVVVSASGLATASRSADLKLAFVKGTGVFRGSMKVTFASGAATAKFSGVVVPGYKPFAVGAAYFADMDGGVSVQRGFAVEIGERGE